MTIVACRIAKRNSRTGVRVSIRTQDWPTMQAWLTRTMIHRRRHPNTMWIEDEYLPAVKRRVNGGNL